MSMVFPNGVSAQDLQKGVEFQIDNDAGQLSSEDDYFDDETSNSFKSELAKLKSSDGDIEVDLESLSLSELKERMTPITEDKLVLKCLLYPGTGGEIPAKSIVTMNYESYIEGQTEPFDSTYKRGKPQRFLFNSNRLIRGLDLSVSTMRVGERAQFWIHYSYAYGPMGCPPRVPVEANVIYKVEIINYIDSAAAIEFEEMVPEDQRNAPFDKLYEVCKVEHKTGNELFKNRKLSAAISRYQRARKFLERVNVKDEEEDTTRNNFLLKLYLNLCVAYYQLKKPNRVMFHARSALRIDENNVKALFYLGRAHMIKDEFDQARDFLTRAKHISPYDAAINEELKNLEDRRKRHIAIDKQFCQRMFQQAAVVKKDRDSVLKLETPEFVEAIKSRVEKFKNGSDEEYLFSSTYTPTQVEVIGEIAKSLNCHFVEIVYQGQKVIKIKKKMEAE